MHLIAILVSVALFGFFVIRPAWFQLLDAIQGPKTPDFHNRQTILELRHDIEALQNKLAKAKEALTESERQRDVLHLKYWHAANPPEVYARYELARAAKGQVDADSGPEGGEESRPVPSKS